MHAPNGRAVRHYRAARPLGEYHQALNDLEERPLPVQVVGDERAQADQRAQPSGQESERRGTHRARKRSDEPRDRRRQLAIGQHARRALGRLRETVAQRGPSLEHRAALADPSEPRRVARHPDAGSGGAGGPDFRQAKAGHERMHVHDVRPFAGQPRMQRLGPARCLGAAHVGTRGGGAHAVAEDGHPFVFV